MSNEWRDRLAGARMQVDQQFNDRVRASQFTNQQWGLIMTAVEFEIEHPEDPTEATLIANTDQVEHIIPELDNLSDGMGGGMGGGGMGGSSGGSSGSGGILGRIRSLVGSGSSDDADEETLDAAAALTSEYADELQEFLEKQGRWASVCESAAAGRE